MSREKHTKVAFLGCNLVFIDHLRGRVDAQRKKSVLNASNNTHTHPLAHFGCVSAARGVEAEVVLDGLESLRWLRIRPDPRLGSRLTERWRCEVMVEGQACTVSKSIIQRSTPALLDAAPPPHSPFHSHMVRRAALVCSSDVCTSAGGK